MQCSNHLKQIGLALQNYHDVFQALPFGARARYVMTSNTLPSNLQQMSGPSWYVGILPFCEQKPLSDQIEQISLGTALNLLSTTKAIGTSVGSVMYAANNQKIQWMLCPSSPLPQTELLQTKLANCVVPSYVGISGATMHGANVYQGGTGETLFKETRVKPTGLPSQSQQSWGGMLCPNETYGIAACLDGTSNTIIVSEASDYFYSQDTVQKNRSRMRIDGTYFSGTTSQSLTTSTGGWWFIGMPAQAPNAQVGTIGYNSSFPSNSPGWNLAFNIRTLRCYAPPA